MLRVLFAVLPILIVAALGLPWQALAAESLYPHAGTPTQWFMSLDVNHDGYLDEHELQLRPEWAKALAESDHNQDRRIDHREFLSLLDRMHSRR